MSKKIWFVHHYAGAPSLGMSYRAYYLTREFNKLGHKACIVSANFHHLIRQKLSSSKPKVSYQEIDHVPYFLINAPTYTHNNIKRIINMLMFTHNLRAEFKKIIQSAGKPDVIICASPHPFTYLATQYIATHCSAKHIFDVQDLWPESIAQLLNVSKYHPLMALFKWIEKKAYRNSDAIVGVMENAYAYLSQYNVELSKFHYIPNGVDQNLNIENTLLPENLSTHITLLKKNRRFILAYVGAHGTPNALDQLIEAAAALQLKNNGTVHVVLVGSGTEKSRLQKKAATLENVSFWDPICKNAVSTLLSQIDACFIGWQDKPLYQFGVCANKIFDYMLAAKPIIHAVNTDFDPIQNALCGIICPPNKPLVLADQIESLANTNKDVLIEMGNRGKDYVIQHHLYSTLADQYSALF